MIVLVHKDEGYLSVVNPLRLTEDGQGHLKHLLGNHHKDGVEIVRNLIRLGPSEHAAFDDEYYLKQYFCHNFSQRIRIKICATRKLEIFRT